MKSLKQKLIKQNFFIVLSAILIVSVPIVFMQYTELTSNSRETAKSKVKEAVSSINIFLSKPFGMIGFVAQFIQTQDPDRETTENLFEKITQGQDDLGQLFYSGTTPYKDGGFFYSNDHWNPGADYDQTKREWYTAAEKSSSITASNPFIDMVTHKPVADVVSKITIQGAFKGVVGLDIKLDSLAAMSSAKLSASGVSYILNKDGMYVTNSDENKILTDNFFTDYKTEKLQKEITDDAVFFTTNAGSGRYLAACMISDETGWYFVTTGPVSELYAPIIKNLIVIIILAVCVLILSTVLTIISAHSIVKPIKIVDTTINTIASGNADLTNRITVKSDDEIGSLVSGFNKFAEKLQTIIKDIKNSKELLSAAGDELQNSSQNASSSIIQINANIESMYGQITNQASSVEETAGAVNEIASNIASLEKMIENQVAGVTQASASVEEMIGNIGSVNTSVEKMAQSFDELEVSAKNGSEKQNAVNERIQQIESQSQMLQEANKTIASIAQQTNLLAMNAAIEAAHAGDSGKGFSVVADEIRKLSETSTAQSKTIGTQLRSIKESINTVVEASSESSQVLLTVSEKIKETDELVRLIKSAMAEQTEGSKQIGQALHSMNDSTSEVRTASAEMSAGNQAILEEVKHLQDATVMMKDNMSEMAAGAGKINESGTMLAEVSKKMDKSIMKIGSQIDQFKV